MRLWRQDKGQELCIAAFLDAIQSGRPAPILYEEIIEIGGATNALAEPEAQHE